MSRRHRDRTHWLYRFYDAAGEVIYVGITSEPAVRFKEHRWFQNRIGGWWQFVDHVTLTQYPDRDAALAAEYDAIRYENPPQNRQRYPLRIVA